MKRGQLQISFGIIFSIILIATFMAVAFYAITFFLNAQKCALAGEFKADLQEQIKNTWAEPEGQKIFEHALPSGIKYVCFLNLEEGPKGVYRDLYESLVLYSQDHRNMFYYPPEEVCDGLESFEIKYINITEITKKNNPYCIKNEGKVSMRIEKGIYESKVRIS